jgi:5-bromo-4-chloroindolyl phosphate hydrolysis protein
MNLQGNKYSIGGILKSLKKVNISFNYSFRKYNDMNEVERQLYNQMKCIPNEYPQQEEVLRINEKK